MVLQPDTHGLLGDLKNVGHIRDQLLAIPARLELVKASLYLGQRHQKDGPQQIRLHFHCAVLRSDGVRFRHHSRALTGSAVLFLMQQPVCQFMRTGKAQPACGGVLSAEGTINKYGTSLDLLTKAKKLLKPTVVPAE